MGEFQYKPRPVWDDTWRYVEEPLKYGLPNIEIVIAFGDQAIFALYEGCFLGHHYLVCDGDEWDRYAGFSEWVASAFRRAKIMREGHNPTPADRSDFD